tara:strand:+ start:119 stop:523 length:405 start_codon:yes stop_codon:yes gene_type:complete
LKKFLLISLFISFIFSGLNHLFPYIDYVINKTEIIDKFCENKDKPMLQCDGKCYLRKQVASKINIEKEISPLPFSNPFNNPTKSFENFNPYCNKIAGLEKTLEVNSKFYVSYFMYFQKFKTLSKNIDLPPPKFS